MCFVSCQAVDYLTAKGEEDLFSTGGDNAGSGCGRGGRGGDGCGSGGGDDDFVVSDGDGGIGDGKDDKKKVLGEEERRQSWCRSLGQFVCGRRLIDSFTSPTLSGSGRGRGWV